MFELLIPVSCLFFLFALVPGRHRTYAAIIAWITIIIVFIGGLPTWIEDSNILYPVMALLSIPFLIITTRLLLKGNDAVIRLTRAAGVAFIIYAPFAFIEEIGKYLIATVVHHTYLVLQLLPHQPGGLEEQDDDEEHKGEGITVARELREEGDGHDLDQPEEHSAYDGALDGPDAAEDRRRERFQAWQKAHRVLHRAVVGGVHHAGDGGQDGADDRQGPTRRRRGLGGQEQQREAEGRAELEANELDDVGVDRATFADSGDDGGEVVVGEHHRRRLLQGVHRPAHRVSQTAPGLLQQLPAHDVCHAV